MQVNECNCMEFERSKRAGAAFLLAMNSRLFFLDFALAPLVMQ